MLTKPNAASPDTTFNKPNLIVLLTGLLLSWFALPLLVGAANALLLFIIVAFVILVLRLLDRKNAIWAIAGIVIGILIPLLSPNLNSSVITGDELVRVFLVLVLVFTV